MIRFIKVQASGSNINRLVNISQILETAPSSVENECTIYFINSEENYSVNESFESLEKRILAIIGQSE